ncbi:threonine/homoserine efflux transporter RhtA [Bacillus oleivorans]|uniref:Threonine/homoserine efflux transporter RhtA n=1 Tax=Bacillus oleivorans TaxID=1448271 RepID=A0A285CQI9_9BACI|nr:DMT family transporter [Bacillus oleivorans]SNX69829.1 threonine/homoserine efflux transporter RhtA [Bacillus oleivorans]
MNSITFTLLILLTTFLMGSSFSVGKFGLLYSSPLLLVALRFILAGIIMAGIVMVVKRPHPSSKENWVRMFIIGTFQTAGVMGCIFMSLRTITASESSILTFTNPLLVVVFSTIFLQTRYKLYQWFGVLLGLVGVIITLGAQIEMKVGIFYGLLSAVFWASSTLLVKKWGSKFDTWVLSAYQMLFGGLLLLLSSFLLENPFFIFNHNSLLILLWLSIMSSIIQFAVWYYLLQKSDPGKTSAFLFLAPFFGVLSGWLLLNDPLYPSIIAGGLLIIIGIYLVNSNFQRNHRLAKSTLNSD